MTNAIIVAYLWFYEITKQSFACFGTQNETASERSISTVEKTTGKTYFTAGSQNEPLLLQEYSPVPESVLIVAEGAGNARIREELFSAVQAFLGLPANKISISEMK